MPYQNISASLPPGGMQQVLQKIADIKAALPFLINLTNEERQAGPHLGDKGLAFVEKAIEYAKKNPSLAPGFLDINEYDKDFELRTALGEILRELNQLTEAVEDTYMAIGKEVFKQSLDFYGSVRMAAKNNIPGTTSVLDDLSKRFEQIRAEEEDSSENDDDNDSSDDSGPANQGPQPIQS